MYFCILSSAKFEELFNLHFRDVWVGPKIVG